MKSQRLGFTLIELLVVIAIISILAAILFPVFAAAREKARQTTCASNEKQIGLALLQYVQDFDEIEPFVCGSSAGRVYNSVNSSGSLSPKWMDLIYSYVQSTGVFTCPSDTGPTPTYTFAGNLIDSGGAGPTTAYFGSYAANAMYVNPTSTPANKATSPFYYASSIDAWPATALPTSAAKIQSPATTVWITETRADPAYYAPSYFMYNPKSYMTSSWGCSGNYNDTFTIVTLSPLWRAIEDSSCGFPTQSAFIPERHSGMTNVLWCDGHVKAVKLDQLLTIGTTGNYTYFTCEADPN